MVAFFRSGQKMPCLFPLCVWQDLFQVNRLLDMRYLSLNPSCHIDLLLLIQFVDQITGSSSILCFNTQYKLTS